MKEITKLMIKEFNLKKLGCDFMGFHLNKGDIYTFHHLIVPHRHCKEMGLGEGYTRQNGSILFTTSHEYLHLIESKDLEIFNLITSEMIDENLKGYIDYCNLSRINELLESFEMQHKNDKGKNGKLLIKNEYYNRICKVTKK